MRSVSALGAAVLMLAFVPRALDAQVYPDRIAAGTSARVRAYQHSRDRGSAEQTEQTTRTLHLGGGGAIDLQNISGDISVTHGSGPDATISIVKTARGSDAAGARDMLALVTVEISEHAGRVEVRTHYPSDGRQPRSGRHNVNVSVTYTVTAPAGTRISAQSISGTISVTDVRGDVTASTISGDVRITHASRVTTAKSISGTIEIDDTKSDGGIEASSVSGDVRLQRTSARRITGSSVSGNVRLDDVESDAVIAHSTSGNLDFTGPLARNGRYELKAFSGEIRLAVAGNAGFEIDANSFSGDVRSDLPITTHGTTDAGGRRGSRRTVLRGTYGDGSAMLNLTTFSGSIVITKK